jgi:hypothetical protein
MTGVRMKIGSAIVQYRTRGGFSFFLETHVIMYPFLRRYCESYFLCLKSCFVRLHLRGYIDTKGCNRMSQT